MHTGKQSCTHANHRVVCRLPWNKGVDRCVGSLLGRKNNDDRSEKAGMGKGRVSVEACFMLVRKKNVTQELRQQ